MQATVTLEFACKTDVGMVRAQNEDAYAFNPGLGFAILADGMGGYNAGEVASNLAVSAIAKKLEHGLRSLRFRSGQRRTKYLHKLLYSAIQGANLEVLLASHASAEYAGMGTTVVVAVFDRQDIHVAHVGDSRLYRFRGDQLEQLTRDHSWVQEQVDAGLLDEDEAACSPERNILTRALGVMPNIEIDIHAYEAQVGDLFLICSDGLSDMLDAPKIASLIAAPVDSVQQISDKLVSSANENGGRDNISVLLMRVLAQHCESEGLFNNLRRRIQRHAASF